MSQNLDFLGLLGFCFLWYLHNKRNNTTSSGMSLTITSGKRNNSVLIFIVSGNAPELIRNKITPDLENLLKKN